MIAVKKSKKKKIHSSPAKIKEENFIVQLLRILCRVRGFFSVKKWRFFSPPHSLLIKRRKKFMSRLRLDVMNSHRLLRAMNVVWGYVIKIKWNIVFIVCDSALKIANVHHSVNFHLGKLRFFIRHRTGDINMNSTLYCRLPLSSLAHFFLLFAL